MAVRDDVLSQLRGFRKPFTVNDVEERLGLSHSAARGRVANWVREGLIAPTGEVMQWVDEAGDPLPGRPRILYRRLF